MSGKISKEETEEMQEIFRKIGELMLNSNTPYPKCALVFKWHVYVSADLDNDNHICDYELQELLRSAGHDVPGYRVREIMQSLDRNNDNKISFNEFLSVRSLLSLLAVEQRRPAKAEHFPLSDCANVLPPSL